MNSQMNNECEVCGKYSKSGTGICKKCFIIEYGGDAFYESKMNSQKNYDDGSETVVISKSRCGGCAVENDRELCNKCWRKKYGDFDECYLCGEGGLCGAVCYCRIVWSVCPTCKVKQIKTGFGSLKCENGCLKEIKK